MRTRTLNYLFCKNQEVATNLPIKLPKVPFLQLYETKAQNIRGFLPAWLQIGSSISIALFFEEHLFWNESGVMVC